MSKGKLNFRVVLYLAVVLICIFFIFVTMKMVEAKRNSPIISFVAEWSREGKPVTVKEIKAADVPAYTKITVIKNSDKIATGFVTADIKDKLKIGQDVFFTDGGVSCGKIAKLAESLDSNTGMFPVAVEFISPVSVSGSVLVLFARVHTLAQVLVVPNSILDISRGDYYLWKIENQKAKRVQVKIGLRDGYGAVIKQGVSSGDQIVFSGQSSLKENDLVDILREETVPQKEEEGKLK